MKSVGKNTSRSMNRISICIPSYNRPNLITDSLNSIIRQSVAPYEVIVVDDDSTENMEKVKDMCHQHNFIFIKNNKNLGLMANINKAISISNGDYVVLLHNDDILSPFYISETQKYLRRYPNYNVYTTNGIGINEKNKVIAEYRLFRGDYIIEKVKGIKKLWGNNFLSLLSIIGVTLYRTDFIKKTPFNTNLGNEADLDRTLQLLSKEDIAYIDIPIYFTRLHKDQVSNKNKLTEESLTKYIKKRLSIYSSYEKIFGEIDDYMSKVTALHTLQLLVKYRYSIKKIKNILDINTNMQMSVTCILAVSLIIDHIYKKILFLTNRRHIIEFLKGK